MSAPTRVALLLSAMFFVTSCGLLPGDESPEKTKVPAATTAPEAGMCVADEIIDLDDLAPDLSTVVPCNTPHTWEIVAVADLPKELLSGTTQDERLAARRDLALVDPPEDADAQTMKLRAKFDEFSDQVCPAATMQMMGMGKIDAGKSKPKDGALLPVMVKASSYWRNVSPPAQWVDGTRQLICTVRFGDGGDEAVPEAVKLASQNSQPIIASYLTDAFPIDRRRCYSLEDLLRVRPVDCRESHYGETFFAYNAVDAFGKKFVRSLDPGSISEAEFDRLDKPCIDAMPILFPDGYDKEDLLARADFSVSAMPDDETLFVRCSIVATDPEEFKLPAGTLADNAESVDLVPSDENTQSV